ncbi:MAG: rod shape-determining protein MreC [Flavobacteriales bacterium]|nr:rod shape-determining protein MreC [Flavobacteriales bacterium]
MRDFIRFLDSYKNLLIFILLQIICFSLIFRTSIFQRGVFLSSVNSVTGAFYEWREGMRSYFYLDDENEQLMSENIELLEQSKFAYELVDKNYALINDTLYLKRFTFQYADVINSSKSRLKNYVTLDMGRKQGVEEKMGVLSNMALLGRVDKVTENYSLVTPVINTEFSVGAKFLNSGYFGSLTWPGDDFRIAQISEIPKEANITRGDIVVTRGAGSNFPEGIRIGTVDDVLLDEGGNFYDVMVRLDVDMSKLNRVILIRDMHREELDSLQSDMELP